MNNKTPLRIISLPVDSGGCGHYRIRQPLSLLKQFTEHDTHIIDKESDDMVSVLKALSIADVIVYRQGAETGVSALKQAIAKYCAETRQQPKKSKWVMDIDDNIELISPYSEHYQEYGTEEFYDNHAKVWIWKDGQQGFDLKHNREKVANFTKGLSEADLITVTTERLAKYAQQYNPHVKVLPNCINLEHWWKPPFKQNTMLRVGWSGGISHYEDWYAIKEPLNKLMREHPFKLVMVGCHFEGLIDEDNKHLVEVHEWVPFKGHSYHMMCMNLDIAIIPLANLPFNHFKSSVKWYEMSALGIPSVVSNVPPYADEVCHDRTGLLYKTKDEFYNSLRLLLNSPTRRAGIGKQAREWVEKNRGAKENANLWAEAYA